MPKLTPKELNELVWFLEVVLSWNEGGPYGDGDEVTNKQGQATMRRVLEKLSTPSMKVD